MSRLDYSVFGRMLERRDMGFISYVNFIHMEVNQSHPIKIAFCEILIQTVRNKNENINEILILNRKTYNKTVRNRWYLAVILAKINGLYKQRKSFLKKYKPVPKAESFEEFLERKVNFKSIGSLNKISKSKSTASMDTVDELTSITISTNSSNGTIDSTYKNRTKKVNTKKLKKQRPISQDSLNNV